jgi:hypothetical protein
MAANSTYALGTNDTAATITANVTAQRAQQINGPASAIVAIETVLGNALDLKGSMSDLVARLAVSLAADGSLLLDNFLWETGDICQSARSSKTGWLLMSGADRSNTTYEDLLDQLISRLTSTSSSWARLGTAVGTPTADAGTDTFTLNSHGLANNAVVYFTNSGGALPTGVSALTKYYIVNTATNTFQISATRGGSVLNFTTNGTGTQSVYSTFIVDGRGISFLGADNMGGSSRNKVTTGAADAVGQGGGSEDAIAVSHTHTITDPGHSHNISCNAGNSGAQAGVNADTLTSTTTKTTQSATTGISVDSAGSSGTSMNLHPYGTVNYFIKT